MGEGNYGVFHHKDGDLDIWTYGESDRPPTHTCILLGGHGCTIGSMVNEFFADIMPRLLQYKSDRETLQYLCSTHCYMLIRKRACGLGSVVRVSRVSGAFSHRGGCGWAKIQLDSKYSQNEVHILSTAN